MCGLQPRDDLSDAAVMLHHNRCVNTKQHEDSEGEYVEEKTRGLAGADS